MVTVEEEEEMEGVKFYHIKMRCFDLYHPLQQVVVDERMVKSKAFQYMSNKPTKWGFKLWVLADTTGYTL